VNLLIGSAAETALEPAAVDLLPAVSSSASISRADSPSIIRCCCSTSRRRRSTAKIAAASMGDALDRGTAILGVFHDDPVQRDFTMRALPMPTAH
jgi:hypothetical protein